MSFSYDTKVELCEIEPKKDCCQHAMIYGLLLFGKNFSLRGISIRSQNKNVIRLYANYIAYSTSAIVDIRTIESTNKSKNTYRIDIPSEQDRAKIVEQFGYSGKEVNLRLNRANLSDECCYSAFLRGVFLSCGSISNPQKSYRLEFRVAYEKLAYDLQKLIMDIDDIYIEPSVVSRKGSYYVYIKNFDQISDILAFIGAGNAAMEFIQTKMVKEVRSYVNRTTNFETANISKTASAAAAQITAIRKISEKRGLDFLDDDLKELAQIRLENPQMSLTELARLYSKPVSRSGINRRLSKIIDIANNKITDKL